MTITELIAALEALKAEHGDLRVCIPDKGSYDDTDVVFVRFANVEPVYSEPYPGGAVVHSLSAFADQHAGRRGTPAPGVLLN